MIVNNNVNTDNLTGDLDLGGSAYSDLRLGIYETKYKNVSIYV